MSAWFGVQGEKAREVYELLKAQDIFTQFFTAENATEEYPEGRPDCVYFQIAGKEYLERIGTSQPVD